MLKSDRYTNIRKTTLTRTIDQLMDLQVERPTADRAKLITDLFKVALRAESAAEASGDEVEAEERSTAG